MKRITNYLIALAVAAFTFTSCEDVPSPFGSIVAPEKEDVVVVTPTGTGTEADPFNVAAVLKYVSDLGADIQSDKEVYIKGIISEVQDVDVSGTYGNATYYISDDAEGKSNKFMIYRGYGLGGKKFNEGATPVKDGDNVIIKSKVVNYKGNTPETVQNNCIIVELNGVKDGGSSTPSSQTLGTKDAPITVTKALEYVNALADNGTTKEDAYVIGKITKIITAEDKIAQYKNIDYMISDGTNEIEVFRGKNIDNTDFTEAGQINVGDEVVVFGKLTKYVKDTKVQPEIAQGNYIVKLTKGSGGGDTPAADLGTKDAPLTVAKALDYIKAMEDGAETETEAFVKGKISKVQSYSDKYKSITYYISDDGTETNQLQIYSGKNVGGAEFASKDDLAVGDEVVVKGKLKKYMKEGQAIPEMNQPNEIISITKASGGGGETGNTSLDSDFKTNGQGDWTITNVKELAEGVSYVWSYDNRYGMKASAYISGTRYETDSWLVSPALNLANGGTMTFKQALNYATSEYVKVMYTTTNGTGEVKTDEWKEATVDTWPAGNNWTFIESKATLPAGTVRVALRYTSTTSTAATWEIETVSIK